MNDGGSYEQKITQEAEYWGRFEEEANKFGIPWWCDLRRATKLSRVICSWMHDPAIENALRGGCKKKLIDTASRVKGRALDIGCGAGWLSLELARRGMDVEGFEISPSRLAIAQKYLKENPFQDGFGSVAYSIQDMNTVQLEKGKYRAVVSWDTLHHIPEIDSLMRRISDALMPGGYFVVYDHVGFQKFNRQVVRVVKVLISPLLLLYRNRKRTCPAGQGTESADAGPRVDNFASPFEDVSGYEMAGLMKKYFEVEFVRTQLCFLSVLANELMSFPDRIKYPLYRALKILDDLFIAAGLVRGEYIFIVARKR